MIDNIIQDRGNEWLRQGKVNAKDIEPNFLVKTSIGNQGFLTNNINSLRERIS
jgi:hypothetical protein